MKRLLFITLILFGALTVARAQTPWGNAPYQQDYSQEFRPYDQGQMAAMLYEQNRILDKLKTDLIVSLAGGAVFATGYVLLFQGEKERIWDEQTNERQPISSKSLAGITLLSVGAISVMTGSTLHLINSFRLYNSKQRINQLTLRYGPDGIVLVF